jgi:hypothetical protein
VQSREELDWFQAMWAVGEMFHTRGSETCIRFIQDEVLREQSASRVQKFVRSQHLVITNLASSAGKTRQFDEQGLKSIASMQRVVTVWG